MPLKVSETQPFEFRDFKGLNLTDSRTAIDDLEFAWLENFIPIGKGQVTIVPGQGANLTTVAAGIATLWGFVLSGTSFLYSVNNDGSITQIKVSDGTKTTVATAGQMTTATQVAIWRDDTILFIDPVKGYAKWDGTTFTIIDAAKLGIALAVFEGRVWIVGAGANKRTITFTSPNTNNDFNPANGSGSVVISDEAFQGQIFQLLSALEQLWIIGASAIDAISNVATVSGVTTFSITNIVTNVGSIFPNSVTSFFRTFLFLSPFGIYAIVGATPQKLSDKIDGLFPFISFGTDQPAAVGTIFNVFVHATLVTSMDSVGGTGIARPLLLCFTQGKWFLGSQGANLKWITSVVVNGTPQIWGSDGSAVYQLFKDVNVAVPYLMKTKLWDFGLWTQIKELLRVGFEFITTFVISPTLSVENESLGQTQPLVFTNASVFTWTGSGGALFSWTGLGNAPFTWILTGLVLARRATNMLGHYLGMTLSGTEKSWTLSALALLVKGGSIWD